MPDPHNERLEAELGRVLVAQLAPAELPLFGAMSRAFFADPKRARPTSSGGDEILAFGVAEAAGLLTPAVLTAACEVALYLTKEVGKAFAKVGVDSVVEQVKRLFQMAFDTARQFKLSNAKASLLADALVGHFALGTSA